MTSPGRVPEYIRWPSVFQPVCKSGLYTSTVKPSRGWLRDGITALLGFHVHDNVIDVGCVSFTTTGCDAGGGSRVGFVRWNAMFGFTGDSTDSDAVADVSPDMDEATHVYWPESLARKSSKNINNTTNINSEFWTSSMRASRRTSLHTIRNTYHIFFSFINSVHYHCYYCFILFGRQNEKTCTFKFL